MTDFQTEVVSLARELVSLDSRSFVSNLAVAERVEAALPGFDIERIDYTDDAGVGEARAGGASRPDGRHRAVRPHGHGARHRLAGGPVVGASRHRRHPARSRQHRHEGPGRRRHRRGARAAGARADHAADHHRRGDHQAGRAADRADVGAGAAGEAAWDHRGGADRTCTGARTSQPHRVHLRRRPACRRTAAPAADAMPTGS